MDARSIQARVFPRNLKRWEVVELINWCQGKDEDDESVQLQVSERGPDKIAIEALKRNSNATLVVDWHSGDASLELEKMTQREGVRFWSELLSQALDGKIEKAIHRGYFSCKLCSESVWLSGPDDIREHLVQHKVPVEQVFVGDGIVLKVGDKAVDVEDFLVGEDTPIQ